MLGHIDGPDKLKPFGIAISGRINGFSKNIFSVYLILLLQVLSHNYDFLSYNFDIFNCRLMTSLKNIYFVDNISIGYFNYY